MCAAGFVMVLSCGALLDNFDLVELARRHGGRILVPSGALLGLDAVAAAAEDGISSVHMITRKPPRGLLGAPYLVENAIDIGGLTRPKCVFTGTARDAARGFPANVNVAAALALAGIGPDRTTIEIWADPNVTRNTHRIEVEADSRPLLDADRKRADGREPAHRPDHRSLGHRRAEETGGAPRHWDLIRDGVLATGPLQG